MDFYVCKAYIGMKNKEQFHMCLFLKYFIYFFREQEGRERERHQCVVAPHMPPTGDLACNPGVCPNWELNRQPFASQLGAQSTEPHQPGKEERFEYK